MKKNIPLLALTFAAVGTVGIASCGDYAKRNICFFNADPGCQADFQDPSTPNIVGPNPNYPDPNVWKSAAGKTKLDAAPSKIALRINEVMVNVAADGTSGQRIELLNDTGAEFDAGGHGLRTANATLTFPAGTIVPSGSMLVIHIGQAGSDAVVGDFFWADCAAIDANLGYLALVSPKGMICDYVQWGEGDHELEAYAVAEGQWLADTRCRPVVTGASLAFVGSGNLPTDFTAKWPTIGSPNE